MKKLFLAVVVLLNSVGLSATESIAERWTIEFEEGTAKLTEGSLLKLDELARRVPADHPDLAAMGRSIATEPDIEITDPTYLLICSYADDNKLERKREAAVEEYLKSLHVADNRWSFDTSCSPGLLGKADRDFAQDRMILLFGRLSAIESKVDTATSAYSDYVPDEGWTDWPNGDSDKAVFYEGWFGNHLKAMDEPSFRATEMPQRVTSRFRLTSYPNSLPAYTVRIDQSASNSLLSWVVLDGAGGYDPGKVAATGNRLLTAEERASFNKVMKRAQLEKKPMEEPFQETEAEGNLIICIHGTHWVFEHQNAANTIFLERGFCGRDEPRMTELIDYATDLAGAEMQAALDKIRIERFGE